MSLLISHQMLFGINDRFAPEAAVRLIARLSQQTDFPSITTARVPRTGVSVLRIRIPKTGKSLNWLGLVQASLAFDLFSPTIVGM